MLVSELKQPLSLFVFHKLTHTKAFSLSLKTDSHGLPRSACLCESEGVVGDGIMFPKHTYFWNENSLWLEYRKLNKILEIRLPPKQWRAKMAKIDLSLSLFSLKYTISLTHCFRVQANKTNETIKPAKFDGVRFFYIISSHLTDSIYFNWIQLNSHNQVCLLRTLKGTKIDWSFDNTE